MQPGTLSPQERDANSTMVTVSCDARGDKVVWSPHSPRSPLAGYLGLPRKTDVWTSPAVQWLRICLPMKGTRAPSLSVKVPHSVGQLSTTTPEPTHLGPRSTTSEADAVRSPHTTKKSGPHSPQLERAYSQQRRPSTVKSKFNKERKSSVLRGVI